MLNWLAAALSASLMLLCLAGGAAAQRQPPNSCGNVLSYERRGNQWIGRVTPDRAGLRNIDWKLRFMAHGSNMAGSVSGLEPYPDKQTALQHMYDGGRGESFVRFQNFGDELPKIILAELNGRVLCTGSEYGAPSTTMTRTQHISVSSTTLTNQGSEEVMTRPVRPIEPRPQIPSPLPNGNRWHNNLFLNHRFNDSSISETYSSTFGDRPGIISHSGSKPVIIFGSSTHKDPTADECGVEGFAALAIGGQIIPRGRFPWMTALYHDEDPDPKVARLEYKCVASLISARTVITAAHCIFSRTPDDMRIYVGRHDQEIHPEDGATLMEIESVLPHPDFKGNLVPDLDIGLLVLSTRVEYSTYVRPICLWTSSSSLGTQDDQELAVAGWGIDKEGKNTRFPKVVNVQTVSREQCLREMSSARHFLTPRTICAGNSQRHGPCQGDSGGGLMVKRNNRWMVRGIVSVAPRSAQSCDLNYYVIYCDVARHLSWVEQNMVR